jgi:putative ABC transport system substrate-binding protein
MVADPVGSGFVASLARPGGNVTGFAALEGSLGGKWLELLKEIAPPQLRDVREAGARLGLQLVIVHANVEDEFDAAFSTLVAQRAGALLVCASPFFNTTRQQLVVFAARHALPAIFEWRDYATAGGLMSYGTVLSEAYHQVGIYAGRILKGAKASDLPIVESTKFEFVINLSTAKALRVEVPPTLSARADEVIE